MSFLEFFVRFTHVPSFFGQVDARGMREGRDPFRPASLRKLGLKQKQPRQSWSTETQSGVDGHNSRSSSAVTATVADSDTLTIWVGGIPENIAQQVSNPHLITQSSPHPHPILSIRT